MIIENQENVMDAYQAILGGSEVELNESEESTFETELTKSNQSVLEAYNSANKAAAEEEASVIEEKYHKLNEKCDCCGEADCKCADDCPKCGDSIEEGMPSKVQILNALKDHSAEEVAKKFNIRLADVKAMEREVVSESSAFKKFMKARLDELANGAIDSDAMLDFFAESELLWEEEQLKEADIKSDDDFKEYATNLLKKAHGDDFDEAKANETIEGILKDTDGDYGAAVGIIQASLD